MGFDPVVVTHVPTEVAETNASTEEYKKWQRKYDEDEGATLKNPIKAPDESMKPSQSSGKGSRA